MKRFILILALISTAWPMTAQVVDSHNSFAIDIYQHLRTDEGNIFFSPLGMYTVLAQLYGGARNTTAEQLAVLLHKTVPDEEFHPAVAGLMSEVLELRDKEGPEISIAGAMWPQEEYPVLPEFLNLMKLYGSTIQPLDYQSDPETARRTINRWGDEVTNGMVPELLPDPGIFNVYTRFNLTNALYFKGSWEKKFSNEMTMTKPFHTAAGEELDVEMMYIYHEFQYLEEEEYQVVSLPYAGDSVFMVIVLPREPEGLPVLEATMTYRGIVKGLDNLMDPDSFWLCDVSLPRFSTRYSKKAKETLKQMGITDTFKEGLADFSGIDGIPRWLYARYFIQEAFIDVNEEGTEAAAVTIAGGGCFPAGTLVHSAAGPVPIEMVAPGTRVKAYDTRSGIWTEATVSSTDCRMYSGDLISLQTGTDTVEATGNHPFLVMEGSALSSRPRPEDLPAGEQAASAGGRWVEARHIRAGDILLNKDNERIRVSGTRKSEDSLEVFNLRIDELQNYCVGDSGILVHNKGEAGPPVMNFYADHPFLYFIVDRSTGCILFMGRVVEP